jgi:hypothetical protein
MTTAEQPGTDQSGTWTPYWRPMLDLFIQHKTATGGVSATIKEYRRQQAAQGIVEVPAALRARAERLRRTLVEDEGYTDAFVCPTCTLLPGDLADDIIAPVGEVGEE